MNNITKVKLYFGNSYNMNAYIPIPIIRNIGNMTTKHFPAEFDDMLVVSHMSNQEIPLISLPFHVKRILVIVLVVSLIVGTYYKNIMYRCVFTTNSKNRGWMHRPINILIVTSAVVHHATHFWVGMVYAIMLMMDISMADAVSDRFCQITYIVGLYGLMYLSVGSFGITLYRMMYIKREHWIKNVIGEKRLLGVILTLGLFLCGMMVHLYNFETVNERPFLNTCFRSSSSDIQTMIDYELSLGAQILTTAVLRKSTNIILIGLQVIEFSIYVWFFRTRYKQDNGKMKHLLTQENIKDRNIQNVTTFVGQFYGFLVEYVFLLVTLMCTHLGNDGSNHLQAYATVIKFADFGLLSAVEVYSSPVLRRFMK